MEPDDIFSDVTLHCLPYAGTHIHSALKGGLILSLKEDRKVIVNFNEKEYVIDSEQLITQFIANQIPNSMWSKGE